MSQTLLEKLQLTDERNLLIQGLPSSIEKQFVKLAFAKNLTPLLKSKKIDFALIFAINEQQLRGIVQEVLPALRADGKFWVAYPKPGSKIATTLTRECSWVCIKGAGYEIVRDVAIDHVWTAVRFKKAVAPVHPPVHFRAPARASALGSTVLEEVVLEETGSGRAGTRKPASRSRRTPV